MPPVWAADWAVNSELATELIEASFPSLAPVSLKFMGEGWDNYVYMVNESVVFRFPRRKVAIPAIETEIRFLPWLAAHLPIKIPNPCYVGSPSAKYPSPFAGYFAIPGKTIVSAQPTDDSRITLARSLGSFLSQLHHVPVSIVGEFGVTSAEPAFTLLTEERRRPITAERMEILQKEGIIRDRRRIDELLDRLPFIRNPRADTLVHGDLHMGQVLLDETGSLTGVLDWGDVHVGDVAQDFAVVHALLPRDFQRYFLEAYGTVDPIRWMAARARAIVHTVALAARAVDMGDAKTAAESKQTLARLTEQ